MEPLTTDSLQNPTTLGRLLSRAEQDPFFARELVNALGKTDSLPHRIGITGSPGVGKSTFIRCLAEELILRGGRVGVIAIDPTSSFSGGAVLGDRVRISSSEGVFVRSLASRGNLGGISYGALAVAEVMERAGFSHLIIETVGVGQTGSDILALADTIVVLLSPEGGDGLQMVKAGLLEAGDVFVVNKSDRPGAEATLSELEFSLMPQAEGEDDFKRPAIAASALNNTGISEAADAVAKHHSWLKSLPADHPRRIRSVRRRLLCSINARINAQLNGAGSVQTTELAAEVAAGKISASEAEAQILTSLKDAL